MVRRTRLARRLALYVVVVIFILMFLINGSIILLMELRLNKISSEASDKYLDAKIQSMDVSSNQFVQSFDQLLGGMKIELNNTVQAISSNLYAEGSSSLYEFNSITFNGTDEQIYSNGNVNLTLDRENYLSFIDNNEDGINDYETPGGSIFGDVINQLNVTGAVYLQINASFSGQLSLEGNITLLGIKDDNTIEIDITDEFDTLLSNSINSSFLDLWNQGLYSFPGSLNDTINALEPDYLQTYFLIHDVGLNGLGIISAEGEKSRIEGCINGTMVGDYSGVIKGNMDGSLIGHTDTRLKQMFNYMIPLLNPVLQWVYFATPDYFYTYPWIPDFGSEINLEITADYDWTQRPWYSELHEAEAASESKGMESHFSNLGVDYTLQYIFISLGQAIYDEHDDLVGFWVLDIDLDYLMNTFELNITADDFSLIINLEKEIVISPQIAANTTRFPKEEFPTTNIDDYNNTDLQVCVDYVLNYESGYRILTYNNTEYVVLYKPIASIPWFLLHFSPLELILDEFTPVLITFQRNMRFLELVLVLVSVTIIIGIGSISTYMTVNFSKYAIRLLEAMRAVSEGDFSVSFGVSEERSIHEISEIYFAFEEMALKLEESIRKEREATHLAELAIDLFTHDLSNYHQAILGYLEMARMVSDDPKQVNDFIGNAIRIINRANLVKDKIRKLSGLEKTTEPYEKRNFVSYIDEAFQVVRGSYPDIDIVLEKNFDENIEIFANVFLVDVFSNIFDNALQSTTENRINFNIQISPIKEKQGDFWQVIVEDDGIGISDDMKQQIFQSFDSGIRIRGLGMMFIYRIIKAYEGIIKIEDRIEGDHSKGTRIVFTIRDYK